MSVANNLCDQPMPKYLDSKTVLIYCPHPVYVLKDVSGNINLEIQKYGNYVLSRIFLKIADLENLDHGLEDEDETDERGENIFGELGEVFHQAGTLKKWQFFY